MVVLSEWVEEQSDVVIGNIHSRGLILSNEEIRATLKKMGSTLSLRKIHRKIAIMYVILQLEENEIISTHMVLAEASKLCREKAQLTIDMCSTILLTIQRWGYIQTEKVKTTGERPINMHRRTSLV